MPQVGIQFGSTQYSWAEAEAAAQRGELPYPVPLLRAMNSDRNSQAPSASNLASCLRQFELKRTTEYYSKPTGMLPSLFGTAFHTLLETYTPEGVHKELKLQAWQTIEIDGEFHDIAVRGTVDNLVPGEVIDDYKTKVYIPKGFQPSPAHKAQVNVYNWLAVENGYEAAKRYRLIYISQTWLETHGGELRDHAFVGAWIRKRLTDWYGPVSRGLLPAPVPELFQQDAKGKPLAPCAYCEVREACLAAIRAENPAPFPTAIAEIDPAKASLDSPPVVDYTPIIELTQEVESATA